jgi:glycosyltransferase involved in cell wall biosynthesis
MNSLKVHRAWIYVSKSKSIIIRLINYFSFVFSSLLIGLLKIKKHDILIVESPPLFLGITAYLLSRVKKAELVFNVSDLWPESAEKLGLVTNKSMLKLSTFLEEFCYRKASLISGQTQGICKNISTRFPEKKVYWLKNGVDVNFYNTNKPIERNWREENGFLANDFILIYAGIMGYAQGLEVIIEAAKNLVSHNDIRFVFLGSGPEKEKLLNLKNKFNLGNITFFEAVPKTKMQDILMATDASIIPLRKLDIFKGAIPSKIFENLALKKPIILGVEGEAKELFIDEAKAGLAFEPENSNDLSEKIKLAYNNRNQLSEFGNNGYLYVKQYFSRDIIANELWDFLNDNIKTN